MESSEKHLPQHLINALATVLDVAYVPFHTANSLKRLWPIHHRKSLILVEPFTLTLLLHHIFLLHIFSTIPSICFDPFLNGRVHSRKQE